VTQQIEDRLRDAFREKAASVPAQAPPLRLEPAPCPVVRRGVDRAGRQGRWRWLAPAATAAAVAAVAAATVLGTGLSEPPAPISAPRAAPGGVPPYYVALTSWPQAPYKGDEAAAVRETMTGKVLARVIPPWPVTTFTEVSGAADDRTFVLAGAAERRSLTTRVDGHKEVTTYTPERFFLLRIDPDAKTPGGRAKLTALPRLHIPAGSDVSAMALSPDGTKLAAVVGEVLVSSVTVYDLAAGTSRTWTDVACPSHGGCPIQIVGTGRGSPNAGTLAWISGDRLSVLASVPGFGTEIRLLQVDAPGYDLIADSSGIRLVGARETGRQKVNLAQTSIRTAFVTPDGKSAFVGVQLQGVLREALLRFSVRTDTMTGVVNDLTFPTTVSWEQVLWTNATGASMVITGLAGRPQIADIVTGKHRTPIPWSWGIATAAW
jgi:hypothetical protein